MNVGLVEGRKPIKSSGALDALRPSGPGNTDIGYSCFNHIDMWNSDRLADNTSDRLPLNDARLVRQ